MSDDKVTQEGVDETDSMEVVADAMLEDVGTYTTDQDVEVKVRKATVRDHPLVLKVLRSLMSYVAKAQVESKNETEFAINFIEDNMPIVLQVVENMTGLSKKEVEDLSLSDFIGIVLRVWNLNQTFFIQVMQLSQGLRGSTPEVQRPENRAEKRKRKHQ